MLPELARIEVSAGGNQKDQDSGRDRAEIDLEHNVQAYEVEEALSERPHIRFAAKGNVKGDDLYSALGQTEAGRYLVIFFINKGSGKVLVISARDMDAKERKRYDKVR